MRHRRGRVFAVALLVVMLAGCPGVAVAARTLGLSSLSFKFSAGSGGTGTGTVVVSNSGDENLTVFVYAADQVPGKDGGIEYVVPNRDQISARSPATWLTIKMPADSKAVGNTPYLELSPGEQVPVDFSFTVPNDAPPGDNNVVLFFEMASIEGATKGTSSNVSGRIGTRITINVQGVIRESVAIEPFHVPRVVFGNEVPYSLTLRNGGNVGEVINADIEMLTSDGDQIVGSRVATETTLYAAEVRNIAGGVVPPGLTIGPRVIRATVTYVPQAADKQVEQRLVEKRTVWLVPLWLAIVVGGLALLGILWVVWRVGTGSGGNAGRRREDERRRMQERRARREALRASMDSEPEPDSHALEVSDDDRP